MFHLFLIRVSGQAKSCTGVGDGVAVEEEKGEAPHSGSLTSKMTMTDKCIICAKCHVQVYSSWLSIFSMLEERKPKLQ